MNACWASALASSKPSIGGWSNPYQKRTRCSLKPCMSKIRARITVATASESDTIGAQSTTVGGGWSGSLRVRGRVGVAPAGGLGQRTEHLVVALGEQALGERVLQALVGEEDQREDRVQPRAELPRHLQQHGGDDLDEQRLQRAGCAGRRAADRLLQAVDHLRPEVDDLRPVLRVLGRVGAGAQLADGLGPLAAGERRHPDRVAVLLGARRVDHDLGERDERLDRDPPCGLDDVAGPTHGWTVVGLAGGASVTSSGTSATMYACISGFSPCGSKP